MAQVTIDVPEETFAELDRKAAAAGRSLSAYISEILVRETQQSHWPRTLSELFASVLGPPPKDWEPSQDGTR